MSLSFLLTSLIVVVSPGTGVLYTLAVALTKGSRASIAAAFGCTLGIIPHMSAAMLGLAAVLHTSALAFAALKYCGVIYLLYMAWQALRETGALAVEARLDARSGRRVIATGFLINILNPKLSIFFLAFPPQFIAAGEGPPDADAGTELRVHGDDACGIHGLRPVRLGRPRPHRDAAESHDLAAPRLRRRFCRARRKTGVRGAVIPDRHAPA
jgi:threonine/homoserine/homoserine lactone efflux protein